MRLWSLASASPPLRPYRCCSSRRHRARGRQRVAPSTLAPTNSRPPRRPLSAWAPPCDSPETHAGRSVGSAGRAERRPNRSRNDLAVDQVVPLLEDVPGASTLVVSLPLRGSLTRVVGLRSPRLHGRSGWRVAAPSDASVVVTLAVVALHTPCALAGVSRWRNVAPDSAGVPWSFRSSPITLMVQSSIDSLDPHRLFHHAPRRPEGREGTCRWPRAACRPRRDSGRRRDYTPARRASTRRLHPRTSRGSWRSWPRGDNSSSKEFP